ncbi:MAG: hypothetical protein LBO71_06150 [Prevotellaceae bacterium]|jgi:hypothetical protein|nr:hypothetical protein [Prevotellaceae bacterium]
MRKITPFLLGGLSFLFVTCDKDSGDDPGVTTVAEDKQNIEALFDRTLDLAKTLESGSFVQALVKFTGLQNGEAKNGDWIEEVFEPLDNKAGISDYLDDNERFSLEQFKGKYDYQRGSKSWTKTNDTKIIVNFPDSPTTTSNNCSVVISEYSDVQVTVNGDKIYVPSKIVASVSQNGTVIASCNASISWETSGFITVKDASITLTTAPYTHTATIRQAKSTEYDISATLFEGSDNPPIAIASKLKLAQAIDADFFVDDEPPINYVYATITKGDLAYDGSLDVNTLTKYDNITTDQINSVMSVNILHKGAKIGELKLKNIDHDEYVFVNYKDGTSDNTELYYEPFLDGLDNILKKYNNNDAVIGYRRASARFFAQKYNRLKKAIHALSHAD